MKLILKITAFAMAAMLFTGCSQKQDVNMTEDELPYGSTMRENKTSFSVPMTYDRRFVEEEQVIAVANYFASIQNQDVDLYLENALPVYTEYQVNQVYSYQDTSQLVDNLHQGIVNQTGEDFEFQMILINEFAQDRNFGGLEAMLDLLDNISDSDIKFSEQIQGAWALELELNFLYNKKASFGTVDSQWVYLFKLDDKYYCCM
ncbi:MAG: hypothetical protein K2H66_03670 [Oscillospiraceae bacterium]|nr:hypothetical protein [Oscillospiraceae bacterium]